MPPYSFERDGDGYRFDVRRVVKGQPSGCLLPLMVIGIFPLAVVTVILQVGAHIPFIIPPLLYIGLFVWVVMNLQKQAKAGALYGGATTRIHASPTGLKLADGRLIPASRIGSIEVRNSFDGHSVSSGAVATGMTGAVLASQASVRQAAASRSYYVGVLSGGQMERIAEKMDEFGASGLAADLIRAVQGQSLG